MLPRIIKRKLVDDMGKSVGTAAFTRFGCSRHGSKTGFVIIRTVALMCIGLATLWDWGIMDHIDRAEKKPNDGDKTPFMVRPQNIIVFLVIAYLVAALYAANLKRKESDSITDSPHVFLFMWNVLPIILTHVPVSFELYMNELRVNASKDLAFEITTGFCFVTTVIELLLGGQPAYLYDVVVPILVGFVFLAYDALFSHMGVNFYTELNWSEKPILATQNAAIYMGVVIANAIVVTGIAMVLRILRERSIKTSSSVEYTPILSTINAL